MCYSRTCPHENYWGDCTLPDPRKCPYGPQEEEPEQPEYPKEKDDDGESDGA